MFGGASSSLRPATPLGGAKATSRYSSPPPFLSSSLQEPASFSSGTFGGWRSGKSARTQRRVNLSRTGRSSVGNSPPRRLNSVATFSSYKSLYSFRVAQLGFVEVFGDAETGDASNLVPCWLNLATMSWTRPTSDTSDNSCELFNDRAGSAEDLCQSVEGHRGACGIAASAGGLFGPQGVQHRSPTY